MSGFSNAYYEEIRGKLQAIAFVVAPNLRPDDYTTIMELLDSNELGLSLELLVEDLEEAELPISGSVLEDLSRLSETMNMDFDVRGPLSRLVTN